MAAKDDTPQFEKDAKALRDSTVAKMLLGRRKEEAPMTVGSANRVNDEARKAAGMKRGGSVTRADGVAKRGKTKGRFI